MCSPLPEQDPPLTDFDFEILNNELGEQNVCKQQRLSRKDAFQRHAEPELFLAVVYNGVCATPNLQMIHTNFPPRICSSKLGVSI
mmetsp:Transcript_14849/g.29123  ORF Transcript_14849/g.29123 Transcript_14849/m.29123 type:complete len:85 (-) Transcript_14849:608-862(-)